MSRSREAANSRETITRETLLTPKLVVQNVRTMWTKRARGGMEADRRNALPEQLPLSDKLLKLSSSAGMVEVVRFYESQDYRPRVEAWARHESELNLDCVNIQVENSEARVIYRYKAELAGTPERPDRPKAVATLKPGTWCQVVYNGRFPTEHTWCYVKSVFNIAYTARLQSSLFIASEPLVIHADLADLT